VAAATIVARLGGRRYGRGWRAPCPAHADQHPSLDIEDRDGRVLFICRAGCEQAEVLRALRALELWPDQTPQSSPRASRLWTLRELVAARAYAPPPACCLNREIKCEHWREFDRQYEVAYRRGERVRMIAELRPNIRTAIAELVEKAAKGIDYRCESRVACISVDSAELRAGVEQAIPFGAIIPAGGIPDHLVSGVIEAEIERHLTEETKHGI
jgi:hypothetical protein